jgi:SAM-dependent methyltransferase
MVRRNTNEANRYSWLKDKLDNLPKNLRILDAGAGELQNRPLCEHLVYVSQDFCQYHGDGDSKGLQTGQWDTSGVDIVCDIVAIPEPDDAFDAILCSEVLEHIPEPVLALDEFARLLKPGGVLILTAPFASLVHFAPHHYCTGFSRYWYECHLEKRGFQIQELTPNGDWFSYCEQELTRLGSLSRHRGDKSWPLAYIVSLLGRVYFKIRSKKVKADDLSCFGWHCIAVKIQP